MASSHCFFHINNIQASASHPFEIKIDSNVIFTSTADIEKKTIEHEIPIPKFASVHNVYINVLSPLDHMDELDRYNLTHKGTHFLIDPTRKSNPVRQCLDEQGSTGSTGVPTGSPSISTKKSSNTSTSSILGVKSPTNSASSPVNSPRRASTLQSSPSANKSQPNVATTTTSSTTTSNIRVPVNVSTVTSSVEKRGEVSRESVFDHVDDSETQLTFWLYGIVGSDRYPLRILVDGLCVFRCEHDLESGKVHVKVKEPKFSPEHKINLSVDMPLVTGVSNQRRIFNEKRFNLSANGKVFLIDFRNANQQPSDDKNAATAHVVQVAFEKQLEGYPEPPLYDPSQHTPVTSQTVVPPPVTISMEPFQIDEYQVDASKLSNEQCEKLLKVQSLQDRGILTPQEADFERKTIIGDKLLSFPKKTIPKSTTTVVEEKPTLENPSEKSLKPIASPRNGITNNTLSPRSTTTSTTTTGSVSPRSTSTTSSVSPRGGSVPRNSATSSTSLNEFIEMKLFLCNVKASESAPFKLIYKPENAVMISLNEDVPPEKIICVKGEIPVNPTGDTLAPLIIDMPKVGVQLDHTLNLTNGGRFAMIGVANNETGKVVCKQQKTEEFESILEETVKEEPSKIYVHFSGIQASSEQPFVVYINDKQAYKREESLKKRQKGTINGDIPRSKRINSSTEENHVVSIRVEAPMTSPKPKIVAVDLTNKGPHVFIFCNQDTNEVIVKQSHNENAKEEEMTLCEDYDAAVTKSSSSSPSTLATKSQKRLTEEDIEYLKKLLDLKNAGVLSEEEYEKKKSEVLF
ncbi:hypothetical protein C9374_002382 [Naegleria lovaniensis]|uniref:SHOCT domain-containing protein n=1 Tax=Naegleria lovaniensis TaxID=51637 RepID=A0AA88GVA4_NAELO|nr:uncharacterized protein C9374_002382 [Naegleria lovaniensis]KAG2386638.1 hypothetical protein C9374_002382 [Naegleria lovaniensis]